MEYGLLRVGAAVVQEVDAGRAALLNETRGEALGGYGKVA